MTLSDEELRALLGETPVERELREERERAGVEPPWLIERERRYECRKCASTMLALDAETCASMLAGLPVRAGNLDGFVLRRALRGGPLPDPETYVDVTAEMLDAVAEAGPFKRKGRR